jgi:hypothetical protein
MTALSLTGRSRKGQQGPGGHMVWKNKSKTRQFANDDLFLLFYFYLFYGYTV